MNAPTDWVSAIAILAAGIILGLLFVVFYGRRKSTRTLGGEAELDLRDLEAKRDALVQQLRDPGAGPDERRRLELETAAVLRELDERRAAATPRSAEEQVAHRAAAAMNPTVKGFLWGAGSVAALT